VLINIVLIGTFLIFLIGAYFFAFAESSTIAAQHVLLHHAATEGDPRAKLVESFRDNPRRFFGTTLIGTNLCIITMSALGAHSLLHQVWHVPLVIATVAIDIVILVVAEITPKTLSLSNPTKSSMKVAGLLEVSSKILQPLIWFITYLPSKLLNIDRIFHTGGKEVITQSQIVHMIALSARQGGIESSEEERAVKVFKFADTTVDEVMTPRPDMVTLAPGTTLSAALVTANESGFSRLPIIDPETEDSPGFLAAKDILKLRREGRMEEAVDVHLRPISFVPETSRILNLLGEFRTSGEQIALVVDEFGTITGLVTLEDLLEEVMGEIYDEYDHYAPDAQWIKGTLVVVGSYPADEFAERLKFKLPEGDFETAAGFFLHLLGRLPKPGESVEVAGWKLIATHVVRHRITRIVAIRIDSGESTESVTEETTQ
jgi:putative hemolysin